MLRFVAVPDKQFQTKILEFIMDFVQLFKTDNHAWFLCLVYSLASELVLSLVLVFRNIM